MKTLFEIYDNWKEHKSYLETKRDYESIRYYELLFDCAIDIEIKEKDFTSGAYGLQLKKNIEKVKERIKGESLIDFNTFYFEVRLLAEHIKGDMI